MSAIKNKSLAVFAVDNSVRGIIAVYNDGDDASKGIFYKTFDQDIEVNDIVIVPAKSRLGFTTNKVVQVDVDPDFERTKEVKWIAGRADFTTYESNIAGEKALMEKLNEGDRARARESVAADLKATMGDDYKLIEAIEFNK